MIDIDELIYSDPRLKELSSKEMIEYDKFMRQDIEHLMKEENISESDIILFAKSLTNVFFIVNEDIRREKSKKYKSRNK